MSLCDSSGATASRSARWTEPPRVQDFPLRLPRGARVRYVDYLNADGLREAYDSALQEGRPLVVPDVVDDWARLASFTDGSLDFVVANHMLEHVEDPIAALQHQLRVPRPGGVLYMTLPDARQSFDAPRERTTPEHLLRDHREGPQVSRREHYEECARHIEGHNACARTFTYGSPSPSPNSWPPSICRARWSCCKRASVSSLSSCASDEPQTL